MIVIFAIVIQGAIWLADSVFLFRSEIKDVNEIQTEYIKAQLKERVASVIDYTDYRSRETEAVLKAELQSRTYEVYAMINNIYESNRHLKSDEEITKMIKDALREIRFNDGRGYFFIDTLDGDVILYPVFPESEGENIIDLQDDEGNYTLQDEIELVRTQGEGFIEGYWKHPYSGDDLTYKKITFVKAFEAYGWYMGCGDYLNEIEKEIQSEVLAYVDSIQYGDHDQQYVFLHDYEGVELANGVYPELVGVNNYELEDIYGSKVFQEQIDLCQSQGGGYLTHYWPDPDGKGVHKKLTYVAPLDKWGWVIGTGVDVSELDQRIWEKEKELKGFIITRLLILMVILLVISALTMLYIKRFTSKINKNFSVFRDSMIAARQKLIPIDMSTLDYEDFSELAAVTNSMTERINELIHYDELTGTHTRRYFKELFHKAYISYPKRIALISFDIDYFKRINDTYGHDIGDVTLKKISNLLLEKTADLGSVARFGGEEFIILLEDVSIEEAILVAENIRFSIETYYIEEIQGSITVSGGLAYSGQYDKDQIFKQADKMLYEAKTLGRNNIKY